MRYLILALLVYSSWLSAFTDYQDAYMKSYKLEQAFKYKEAVKKLKTIYEKYKSDYELNLRLGWLSYLAKDYQRSIKYLKRAMRIKHSSLEAKNMILLPLTAKRDWVMVERYANMVFKKEPKNYYANLRLAYALYIQGKYKRSLGIYLKLHTFYPSDLDVKLGLAAIYLKMGNKSKALWYYREILKANPYHQTALAGFRAATK